MRLALLLLFALRVTHALSARNLSRAGLTYDPCTSQADCQGDRDCLTRLSLFVCRESEDCICFPDSLFDCSITPCVAPEVCVSQNSATPSCVSPDAAAADPSFVPVEGAPPPVPGDAPPPDVPDPPPPADPAPPVPDDEDDGFNNDEDDGSDNDEDDDVDEDEIVDAGPASPLPTASPVGGPDPVAPPAPVPPSPDPSPAPVAVPPSPDPSPAPVAVPPSSDPTPPPADPTPPPSSPGPTRTPAPSVASGVGPAPGAGGGLAGDECNRDTGCLAYRRCVQPEPVSDGVFEPCKRDQEGCVCAGSRQCGCDDDCTDGELCSNPGNTCLSPTLIDNLAWMTTVPCESSDVSPVPSPSPVTGLTGDSCRIDDNCRSPRLCRAGGGKSCAVAQSLCDADVLECTDADRDCYCYTAIRCDCNDECRDTEQCTELPRGRFCASKDIIMQSDWLKDIPCEGGGEEESGGEGDAGVDGDAEGEDDTENGDESTSVVVIDVGIPSPPPGSSELDGSDTLSTSPEPSLPEVISSESTSEDSDDDDDDDDDDDVVCIDAAALDHVARQDLVFSNHVLKAVLCDMYGSCATDGHIVEYRGHAMMMRTYCDLVGCSKREVEVNSPRYRRRLRVPSRTDGLEFTSLAARYSTRVEERLLAIVVHIGL